MDRREALRKAAITESTVTFGLLPPDVARQFIIKIKEKTALSNVIRQEIKTAPTGVVDKVSTASRILRKATENSDDGYRVGAAFEQIAYTGVKVRLPWEVTEDVFHENIEGEAFETTLVDQMTTQFALDLEDLEVNGDTSSGDPFVQINDGLIKQLTAGFVGGLASHKVNGAAINAGAIAKEHFFETLKALPNRYRNALAGKLVWIMSPNRKIAWWEALTNRTPGAGGIADAVLSGASGPANNPLGIPILESAFMPDDTIVLTDPRQLIRIITWDVRKRRVTGETDSQLAALDKRFYIYFLKHDFIIEELLAVSMVTGLV